FQRVVHPLRDEFGRSIVQRNPSVGHRDGERQPADNRLGQRRGAVWFRRSKIRRVPLIDDLVISSDEENGCLFLREQRLNRVELLTRHSLALGRRCFPVKGQSTARRQSDNSKNSYQTMSKWPCRKSHFVSLVCSQRLYFGVTPRRSAQTSSQAASVSDESG